MRYIRLILALASLGGLLFFSQALATGQTQQGDMQKSATMTGEEALQLNQDQVREMQRLLNERGYRIGSIDGDYIGEETTAAIHSFQKDEGLAITGTPNQETLRALAPSPVEQEFFGLSPEFGD